MSKWCLCNANGTEYVIIPVKLTLTLYIFSIDFVYGVYTIQLRLIWFGFEWAKEEQQRHWHTHNSRTRENIFWLEHANGIKWLFVYNGLASLIIWSMHPLIAFVIPNQLRTNPPATNCCIRTSIFSKMRATWKIAWIFPCVVLFHFVPFRIIWLWHCRILLSVFGDSQTNTQTHIVFYLFMSKIPA